MKYVHTNIITQNWKRLAQFYQAAFDCSVVPPERDLTGVWVEKGTGVPGAHIQGVHLRLPGHGPEGPTLEVFEYDEVGSSEKGPANRAGLRHLAFEVDDVSAVVARVVHHGGGRIGEIVSVNVPQAGTVTFCYVTDPDGNIIELQSWTRGADTQGDARV